MVKQFKKTQGQQADAPFGLPAGLFDNQLAQTIKDSAQQIWLAGLGAYSKAQGEGGKVFDTLIKEGATLQRKTRGLAEERISEVSSKMSDIAGDVSAKAGQQWDKLESIFEDRVAKSLKRLGVPTTKDVEALIARIDALSVAVAKLSDTSLGKPVIKRAKLKPVAAKKVAAEMRAAPAKKLAPKRAARKSAA